MGKQITSWMDLAQGQLRRSIDREMTKIMANIMDQNTEAEGKRKLVVTLTLKPNELRTSVKVNAVVKSSLQPETDTMTFIEIEKDSSTGELSYLEENGEISGQISLMDGNQAGLRVMES